MKLFLFKVREYPHLSEISTRLQGISGITFFAILHMMNMKMSLSQDEYEDVTSTEYFNKKYRPMNLDYGTSEEKSFRLPM
jgi:hypothetical protein